MLVPLSLVTTYSVLTEMMEGMRAVMHCSACYSHYLMISWHVSCIKQTGFHLTEKNKYSFCIVCCTGPDSHFTVLNNSDFHLVQHSWGCTYMVIKVSTVLVYVAFARASACVNIPCAEKQCCVLGKDIYRDKNYVDHVWFSSNNNWQTGCYAS